MWRLDELKRRCSEQVLAATLAQAVGAEAEPPDWDEVRAEFDRWLVSEPPHTDPDQLALDRALGLRG